MTLDWRRHVAWWLLALYVGFSVLLAPIMVWLWLRPDHAIRPIFTEFWIYAVAFLPLCVVGALIAARRPDNRIGWLLLSGVLLLQLANPGFILQSNPDAFVDSPPVAWLIWLSTILVEPAFLVIVAGLPLLFPTGRLPSRRWAPLVWLIGVQLAIGTFANTFDLDGLQRERVPELVRSDLLARTAQRVSTLADLLFVVVVLGSMIGLVQRFRHSAGVERQQIKWPMLVAAGVAALFASATIPMLGMLAFGAYILGIFGFVVGFPAAVAVAILRHRLYDIDRLINRTLVYATLTLLTVACYVVWVVLLGRLLDPLTRGSDLAVAGATLAVAALFRPAQTRIQRVVDQRFFRHKYDAAQTIDGFSTRLRDEVDLDSLVADLRAVVLQSMQPAHVSVWLRPADSGSASTHRSPP